MNWWRTTIFRIPVYENFRTFHSGPNFFNFLWDLLFKMNICKLWIKNSSVLFLSIWFFFAHLPSKTFSLLKTVTFLMIHPFVSSNTVLYSSLLNISISDSGEIESHFLQREKRYFCEISNSNYTREFLERENNE